MHYGMCTKTKRGHYIPKNTLKGTGTKAKSEGAKAKLDGTKGHVSVLGGHSIDGTRQEWPDNRFV